MVVGSRGGNVVGGFLREHGGERGIFWGKDGFGFGFLGGGGKFGCSGQFGYDWRSCWDKAGSTPDDLVNGAVLSGTAYVLILRLPIVVSIEVSVGDGVDINMSWRFDGRSNEV